MLALANETTISATRLEFDGYVTQLFHQQVNCTTISVTRLEFDSYVTQLCNQQVNCTIPCVRACIRGCADMYEECARITIKEKRNRVSASVTCKTGRCIDQQEILLDSLTAKQSRMLHRVSCPP